VNEDCLKLTAYFAERDRSGHRFLGDALVEICERHALQTSVLLRGAEGFGRHRVLQSERLLTLSEDLPMVLVAVDARHRIEGALPEVGRVARHGLDARARADADRPGRAGRVA
jgi:PII-like signaling protein